MSNHIMLLILDGPSTLVIVEQVVLSLFFLFVVLCTDEKVTDSVVFASRLTAPFFRIVNMLDSVTFAEVSMHHQNSCLSKYFRKVPLTRYSAIGLMQEFMKLMQNPTIRNTCQKVLYSSVDLGLL